MWIYPGFHQQGLCESVVLYTCLQFWQTNTIYKSWGWEPPWSEIRCLLWWHWPLFCTTLSPAHSPAGFSGSSLTKAALWRHKALESAKINVKLCSISLKQLSSKYLCPHLKAERAIVFTSGVVRGAEFGYQGVQGSAGGGFGSAVGSVQAPRSVWWGQCSAGCSAQAVYSPEALSCAEVVTSPCFQVFSR